MGAIRSLAVYISMTFLRHIEMLPRSCAFGRYPETMWAHCALGTIQAYIALLVLLSLLYPSHAFAVNPDLETVLTGSRQRIEKLDYRLTGRLTRVEGNEKRTSYKFAAFRLRRTLALESKGDVIRSFGCRSKTESAICRRQRPVL